MPLEGICDNTEGVPVEYTPMNASGGPATVDGPLQYSVVSGGGYTAPDPTDPTNPLKVVYCSGDPFEDVVFNVTGDADMGTGVKPIADIFTLHVRPKEAVSLGGTVGAPITKPPAPVTTPPSI